jgi:hypothetical protein
MLVHTEYFQEQAYSYLPYSCVLTKSKRQLLKQTTMPSSLRLAQPGEQYFRVTADTSQMPTDYGCW